MSLVMVLLAAVLLTGCFGKKKLKKCHKQQEYQQAKPGPRVRVPEGMQELPEEERLRMPYGKTQQQPVSCGGTNRFSEKWQSGRMRSLGKRVCVNSVSRVRIPPSPPYTRKAS
jgi:hypothetical protein